MIINDKRALAYIAEVTDISPIEGADNIELAGVLGWKVIVKKGEFNIGDKAIYFEIDSKVPQDDERFAFLEKKKFKMRPVGLDTLAAAMDENKDTIEKNIEPYLIQKDFIVKTSKGRTLTNKGLNYLASV